MTMAAVGVLSLLLVFMEANQVRGWSEPFSFQSLLLGCSPGSLVAWAALR